MSPTWSTESGFDAIALLCDLLEAAVGIKERHEEGKDHVDFSYIWRPAIENHDQNLDNTVPDALIASLRDSVERLSRIGHGSIPKLVALLEKRQWPIFQRIALYLLSRSPQTDPSLVEQRIVDEKLFDNHFVLHEYYHLCRAGFSVVSEEGRQNFLGWIDRGLERETAEKWIKSGGQKPCDDGVDEIVDGWRLDRLTPIKDHLTGQWADHYNRLVQQRGEPAHPDFASWYERLTGPDSPLTQHELSEMPVESILTFLRTWEPPVDSPIGPSPEGFGRMMSAVVAARPNDFAVSADEFRGLEPTYVRALLSGLENALRHGRQFDWKPVLMLCEWVVEQPQSISARRTRRREIDPDWEWTRGQIADVIAQAFSGEGGIPIDHRSSIWRILLPLTRDPYPPDSDAHERNDAWRQPAEDSWNTVRGKAMHAVIRYAMWVKEDINKDLPIADRTAHGFRTMPEVKDVLETHLNPAFDPSLATRSVYGQWLPALIWIDKDWTVKNLEILFPPGESLKDLWRATWDGYVTSCQLRQPVFDILRNQYKRAIGAMTSESASDYFRSDPDSGLTAHVMTAYWNGREALEAPDSLVEELFKKAPVKIREYALHLAGSWLHNYLGDLPVEIRKRLTDLWQWRKIALEVSNDPVDSKELAQFGWWFVSGKLDECWALQQVLSTVQICGEVDSTFQVVERLASLGKGFPELVVDCLEALVQHTTKIWRIYSWREQAFEALRSVIETDHPEAHQKARRVINRFGELGFRDFKSLLDISDKPK